VIYCIIFLLLTYRDKEILRELQFSSTSTGSDGRPTTTASVFSTGSSSHQQHHPRQQDRIGSARYGRRALSATPETRIAFGGSSGNVHATSSSHQSSGILNLPPLQNKAGHSSSGGTSPSPSLPATPTERCGSGLRRGSIPPNLLADDIHGTILYLYLAWKTA
jgi:hypothetical protein